jgi:hypothetical protein
MRSAEAGTAPADNFRAHEFAEALTPESLLPFATVRDSLRAFGVPQTEIPTLLRQLNIHNGMELSPRQLTPAALRYLSIAASLYGRARAVLFDRPFSGSDPAWVERITQLMLQVGEANARIMIATHLNGEPLPQPGNPRIFALNAESGVQTPQLPPDRRERLNLRSAAAEITPAALRHAQQVRMGGTAGLSQLSFDAMQQVRRAAGAGKDEAEKVEIPQIPVEDRGEDGPSIRTLQSRAHAGVFADLRKKMRARWSPAVPQSFLAAAGEQAGQSESAGKHRSLLAVAVLLSAILAAFFLLQN